MAQAKKELTAARLVRKNRKEYALLVGMIDDLPSRAETTKKLEDMQEELSQQQERQQQLEARKLLADEDNELSNEAAGEPGERKEEEKDEPRSQREKSSDTVDTGE
ncbi:hypothetical protein TELCIR_11956 [Teladorsagia circumcincta]|uniref:Uncharacterized protein n=1 Tax=Teladorsagia circumcincta TaxID=45464 RepID=A0A2G9U7W3_TELCI|nr:hypothetical protein TELCIR_11956 [Teladorsagia circumcincta]